jgi:Zn-dependent alcohol dehydrogenase
MKVKAAIAYAAGKPLELDTTGRVWNLMHAGESIRSVVVY